MISMKLAARIMIALGLLLALAIFVAARVSAREQSITAEFPPQGDFLTVAGKRVHVLVQGTGPDVILIHGASGNALDMMQALGADLAKDHRVIAFDRPGLGYSDALADQSLKAQALHLAAAAKLLDVRAPLVIGQSYGGSVSLAWAIFAPIKPRALVLISAPSMPWPGKLDITYRLTANPVGSALLLPLAAGLLPMSYIDKAVAAVFSPEAAPQGYAKAIAAPLAMRLTALRANMAQVNALRAELVEMQPLYPNLTLPIEMIHGNADTVVPVEVHSIPFTKLVASAHLEVEQGAGHMPHYTRKAQVLAAIDRAEHRAALR
jgi:pimeloyl-ACP methyl ester carboxylesterase